MPTVPLPEQPSRAQLRNQARELQRAVRATDSAAVAEVMAHHPNAAELIADPHAFPLSAAQLVVARRHGFASWPRLTHHLEIVDRYSRVPNRVTPSDHLADELIRLACLTYEEDDPARWVKAKELLAEHPEVASTSIHAAALTADVDLVRRFLAGDPTLATSEGGPYHWQPLIHLAYTRHDPDVSERQVLDTATALLEAGADPNAGYLWHGLPTPFTVLTGVFGEGEQGPTRTPRHPHSLSLARLLLEAGADPNDGQALYNRQFGADNDHLELLFEYGLGSDRGGPWYVRLGDALETPNALVQRQLRWAAQHGLVTRVRLLLEHGVDVAAPLAGGRTATELAALAGHADVVDLLMIHGAAPPHLAPVEAVVAAVLASDRAAIDRLVAEHPGVVDQARRVRPGLVAWATAVGRSDAVRLAVELGWDVDARGRSDAPIEMARETALHVAAAKGDLGLTRLLLSLGADPNVRDARFDATPLGWARHFENETLVEVLEPLTTIPPDTA